MSDSLNKYTLSLVRGISEFDGWPSSQDGVSHQKAYTCTYFHLYEGSDSLTDNVAHQTACKCTYFHLYEGSANLTDGVTHQTAYEGSHSLTDGVTHQTAYTCTYSYFHVPGKKVPLQNPIHGCNRDATRCMHTKKLPIVVSPLLPTSNINCQTDQAILRPTFYLNSVSIYGSRNTLVFLNYAASEGKYTYHSNEPARFRSLSF